ncbi:MAG: hypothetical protein AB1442_17925, partial [Nitrospirota bacterium]
MTDVFKILLIFATIVILLRRKINIGVVMLVAASVLIVLYQMTALRIWETCKKTLLDEVTIKLILALSFIRIFEMILREHAVLTQ